MLHIFECNECGAEFEAYCFEHHNYTEEGWKTRNRQMDSGKCIKCFGEVPELKENQTSVPCFDMRTGDVKFRDSNDESK